MQRKGDVRSATPTKVVRAAALALLALLAALAVAPAPARATIVLLSTSSGAPSAQDANLYDWRGQWTSALDRAAPLPGQRPAWQVNVGLYGDWYQPPGSNVIEQDPTCEITLQISGAPAVGTELVPCVEGPPQTSLGGPQSPLPESLTPDLAAAGNGPHTVTLTAYDSLGGVTSSTSFNVDVDNSLPSSTDMVGPVGWQRGGEVVTSTAVITGPSGIAGQYCSIGSSTASWYPGPTAQLAVTGDGTISVRCSAQNNAGVPGPSTEFRALLDNTPPTGYFAPTDPSNPTRAVVDVADPESGVAGGEIEIQNAGSWQILPTSYSAATGKLVATIPDDASMPDGQHALQAVVWDAVGNQATITTNVNAAPESVLLPLRILTQIRVGQASVLTTRCALTLVRVRSPTRRTGHQRPARRSVRRCETVALPSPGGGLKLNYPQAGSVPGMVLTADGEPIAGAQVNVSEQSPGWTDVPAGTVSTGPDGRFTYQIAPGPSRTITFSFLGTATLRGATGSMDVQVAAKGTLTAGKTARANQPLRLAGRLLGGYIPTGGTLIQLQYRVLGYPEGWAPFDKLVRAGQNGYWATSITLPRKAAGFTYQIRGSISAQNEWPFSGAVTNVVSRHVLR